MSLPRIVCPCKKSVLAGFRGYEVAIRVTALEKTQEAAALVRESGNNLSCVIVESDSSVADLEFGDDLRGIPLAIMAPSLGKFRNLARSLNLLRDQNLRIYLSCHVPENLTGLRILSSLGIHCCAIFGDHGTDWESLADLMTYAMLERVPHASIEPFAFIASNYDPSSYLKWGATWFDDPGHFLHLDATGRVALSREDLKTKEFVARNLSKIGDPAEFRAIRERTQSWRQLLAESHPCAACAGWKLCLGRFAKNLPENGGCSAFFQEMMEVAGQVRAARARNEESPIWQP